jgi:hypothetical protein
MKKAKYRTVILLAEVDNIERGEIEAIENKQFNSIEDIYKEIFCSENELSILELTDFMDMCNDQKITSMENDWIGYVQLNENCKIS